MIKFLGQSDFFLGNKNRDFDKKKVKKRFVEYKNFFSRTIVQEAQVLEL